MPDMSFPSGRTQALAIIYAEKHATAESTPEDLIKDYMFAYESIRSYVSQNKEPIKNPLD